MNHARQGAGYPRSGAAHGGTIVHTGA
jgi:hypothetical protein